MKLISCYIENFGTLSHYGLNFSEGLTVIKEANGFGKTTLAAFIRTMFYGMPRASKNLLKNDRKRYMPWQGGKFGGNLIFESNGKQFRIERFFGDTPNQDTFSIIDLKTKKKTSRFSQNVGQDLFELDSDSFERSTFMPQQYQETSLTTSSIQTKLSDLVQDTNDLNNFDKAVLALKAKRTSLRQYRGNAGSIDTAQENITRLKSELEQIDIHKSHLHDLLQEHDKHKLIMDQKQNDLSNIRSRITRTSEAEATRSHIRELRDLKKNEEKLNHQISALNEKYPQGLPSLQDIEDLETSSRKFDALLASKVNAHSVKEISDVVNRLKVKFKNGLPSDDSLTEYQQKYQDYVTTNTVLSQLGLNDEERDELTKLNNFFSVGIPTEDDLQKQEDNRVRLEKLRTQKEYQVLSSNEKKELVQLEQFFSNGVPEEATLIQHQENHQKTTELRQCNVQLVGNAQFLPAMEQSTITRKSSFGILSLVLGAVALAIGTIMFTRQMVLPGATLLATGVLLLAVAIFFIMTAAIKKEVASQVTGPKLSPEVKSQIQANEHTIQELDSQIESFVSRYSLEGLTKNQALSTIQSRKDSFLSLKTKSDEMIELSDGIDSQCSDLEQSLNNFLSLYYEQKSQHYKELDDLGEKLKTLTRLRRTEEEQNDRRDKIEIKAKEYENKIIEFLKPYYIEPVLPERFGSYLSDLGRDCTAYVQATQNLHEIEQAEQERNFQKDALLTHIAQTFEKFGIQVQPPFLDTVRNIRDAVLENEQLIPAFQENRDRLDQFVEKYGDLSDTQLPVIEEDLDSLKIEESNTIKEINCLTKEYGSRQQTIDKTQAIIDQLPSKEDDLDRWTQARDTDEQNCELLDATLEMLSEAKDNLSDNYLNEIERSFTRYAQELVSENLGEILLSPNLDIQLERYGVARDLAYFSVGYTNAVMLCMRLALIEALYKKETPMLILDDPFVNLDDEHTEKALSLLERLAKSQQIIYLVCNSSRC